MLVKFETAPTLSCLWVCATLLAASLVPALMSTATLPVLLIEGLAVVSEAAGTPLFGVRTLAFVGEEVEEMASDIWNDNTARNVGTVRAWRAGKARGPHDGCACDVEGSDGGRSDQACGGPVFRRQEGRRPCRRAEGDGRGTCEGVAGRDLSSGGVDG